MQELEEKIDQHATLALEQIRQQAEEAHRHVRRMAEFPARSAGQKRRYSRYLKLNFKGVGK